MSDVIQSVKGMNDVLPPDSAKWRHLEATCAAMFTRFGYAEVRPPVVESTALFSRGVGEATDIVEKEMYTFPDRAERSLTLRPELTAGCVRAYVQHQIHTREPVTRWWYLGPMFRYERAQTGRYRSFWQIGCEVYGVAEPTIDAEQIAMLDALYRQIGVTDLTVKLNSVGSGEDRPRYRAALLAFLEPKRDQLCADCQRRLGTNPLRILDCKVPTCKAAVVGAPKLTDFLGDASRAHFESVQQALAALGVAFVVDDTLVRGLDYYTGTVFEIVSAAGALGAQSTIVAGGRYDGLVASLGGPATPAMGFALGVERALLCMPGDAASFVPAVDLFLATRGAPSRIAATALAGKLRAAGVTVELEHRDVKMKAQFARADKLGARFAIGLGDEELATNKATLKRMADRVETPVDLADVPALVAALRSPPDAQAIAQNS